MAVVKIHFRNKEVELQSEDPVQLKDLAAKYNQRLNEFGTPLKVSDIKVALVTGLQMEYEIEQLRAKLAQYECDAAQASNSDDESGNGELAQTLEHIALYLNSISEKLEGA